MTSATFGFWYNSKHNDLGYKPNEVKTFTGVTEEECFNAAWDHCESIGNDASFDHID